MKFYPYKKGESENVVAMLKGVTKRFGLVFTR